MLSSFPRMAQRGEPHLAPAHQEAHPQGAEGHPIGLWLEDWTRKALHEATSPKLILEMTAGGMGYRLGRLAGGLLARAGALGAIGRWALPRGAGFLSETVAFSGASLALTAPLPGTPPPSYGEIFASSGVMFASLRLVRAALGGHSALRASAAAYLGIVGNHAVQQQLLGWESKQDWSTMTSQSLAELLTFTLGGHLSQVTMGRLLRPLEHSLDLAAKINETTPPAAHTTQLAVPLWQALAAGAAPLPIFSNEFFTKAGGPKDTPPPKVDATGSTVAADGRGGTRVIPEDGDALAHAATEAMTPTPQTAVVRSGQRVEAAVADAVVIDPAKAPTLLASVPETPPPPPVPRDLMPTMDAPPVSQAVPLRLTVPPTSYAEIGVGSFLGEMVEGKPRYEVVKLLGEGGQGAVYRVIDRKLDGHNAVIKVPRGEARAENIERFEQERRLGTHLKTDKIARVYDLFEVGKIKIPVMQFVEGKELEGILSGIRRDDVAVRKAYPVEKRIGIFVRVVEAVEEIHQDSVIHRDLKPANIMVTSTGQVRILDLGIGKVFTDKSSEHFTVPPPSLMAAQKNLTQAGNFFGTPGYWAPEILQPEIYVTHNPRSYDVFALGAILYETITGVPAFVNYRPGDAKKGEPALVPVRDADGVFDVNIIQVLQLDKSMTPPAFKDVVREPLDPVALELEAVARKAMAPQPADRYASAQELSRAIQLAPARVEKRRLDEMRDAMDRARQQIQQDSSQYRQVEISEAMWEQWNRPVRFLQARHEAWHEGGQNLVEKIISTMKGEEWAEGKRMIAQISWERLVDLGHRINPAVRQNLEQKIRENDLPLEDGTSTGMSQALDGKIPVQFKVTDYSAGVDLTEGALVRVFRYEKELDAEGLETGNYQLGKFIYHGPIKNGRIPVDLGEGFYVFKVYSRGYAVSPKTLHVTLEELRRGISAGQLLDFNVAMVPKALVPKGMIVIPEMEVFIGDDSTQIKVSPFETSSQPQHKVKIGPFLVDKYMTTVGEYREFLEAKLKEVQDQLDKDPKMRQGEKDRIIKTTMEPLLPMEALNKKTKVSIREKVASAVERVRKRLEKEEDPFYWGLVSSKEGKKRIWKLNSPKHPEDHHGVPIDYRKPVEAISQQASIEFLRWRSQTDELGGRAYRLGEIAELEGVARGGLPWTYPFGDRFDPFKVACRSCFPDVKESPVMPVGRHPVRGITGDRSPFGPIDVMGNAREFSSTFAEENAIFVFGGSVSVFNGPQFKPSNRSPLLIFAKYDSFGFRKALDLQSTKKR